MSKFVQVGPLPEGTTIAQVSEIFAPFSKARLALHERKVYIEFNETDDIQSISMKYEDNRIPELGNADINLLPEDFTWPASTPETKQPSTADFIMPPKQQQPHHLPINPQFIVVADCSPQSLLSFSRERIRQLFGKYKLGRILIYKRDVYLEFLDQNEIETLEPQFPGLRVPQLGQSANIAPVDDNFSYEIVESELKKWEAQQASQRQERERHEAQIREKQRLERVCRQVEIMDEISRRSVPANVDRLDDDWSVRPQGERKREAQSQGKLGVFWSVVVALWGVYVMFV